MNNNEKNAKKQLLRLANELVEDILAASDEEILAEATKEFDDVQTEAERMQELIQQTIIQSGKRRLRAARETLDQCEPVTECSVLSFPIEKKRQLLNNLSDRNGLTLAARNGKDQSERDIDSLLEDLLELGEIDEEGNPV